MGLRRSLERLPWQVVQALTPRRTVQSRGLTFTLQCENWITHYRWATYNTKEPETLDWIDSVIQDGDIFFDVGANIGMYSIYAALRHPMARVIAFEPEYANLHLLRDNILKNGLQGRVEVYSFALSDHLGLSYLHVQDLTPGAALHTESKEIRLTTKANRPVVWREGICTYTLDAFCQQTGIHPHGIKIDVDGTELEVLQGAERTLRSPQLRSVTIELPKDHGQPQACGQLLVNAGFHGHRQAPMDHGADNEIWVRGAPTMPISR